LYEYCERSTPQDAVCAACSRNRLRDLRLRCMLFRQEKAGTRDIVFSMRPARQAAAPDIDLTL
jgi:hypothetical protein